MREWLIKLKGKTSDLEDLPSLFTSPDLVVKEEDGAFYLTALELNRLDDSEDVISSAKQPLNIISAAASFQFESISSLEIKRKIIVCSVALLVNVK